MKILVTGFSGFIGKALCTELLKLGHEVMGLGRSDIATEFSKSSRFSYVYFDMCNPLPVEVEQYGAEVLVHLAWDGIPDFSSKKCVANINWQTHFFEEIRRLKSLRKIIAAGSCREYGNKPGARREDEHVVPIDYFSWSKQAICEYLRLISIECDINFVWFRIFYVYGPGQRAASLIPMLINAARQNVDASIANPSAANDFIYIDDVIGAFVKSIENVNCAGTFNLGSGNAISVSQIVAMVDRAVRRAYEPLAAQNIEAADTGSRNSGMWADTEFSKNKLSWIPAVGLEEGIRRTSQLINL